VRAPREGPERPTQTGYRCVSPEDHPARGFLCAGRYRSVMQTHTGKGFPGAELVEKGLADLARGEESPESLLVSLAAPRLRRLGIGVDDPFPEPEERLYLLLARQSGADAHSRYNALVRRIVSFERAAESAR
jgi:hypothetical protein